VELTLARGHFPCHSIMPDCRGKQGTQWSSSWATTAAPSWEHPSGHEEVDDFGLDLDPSTDAPLRQVSWEPYDRLDEVPQTTGVSHASGSPAEPADPLPEHFANKRPFVTSDAVRSRIALLAFGLRGDVEPFVALAQTLHKRGHVVRLLTSPDFIDFCKSAHVDAVATFPGVDVVQAALVPLKGPNVDEKQSTFIERSLLKLLDDAGGCREALLAAREWSTTHACEVADALEELAEFQPSLVLHTMSAQHQALRFEHFYGVPAVPAHFTSGHADHVANLNPPRPLLFAVSGAVDCATANGWMRVTGPWCLKEEVTAQDFLEYKALGGLRRFVEDSTERPVVFSHGSMRSLGVPPVFWLALVLRAMRSVGRRAVILGGAAKLDALGQQLVDGGLSDIGHDHEMLRRFAREKVHFVAHAPHCWLLPRSCCLVHHGGAGTTQAAIRAGCPSVVVPVGVDQFHFAQRVEELRAGVTLSVGLAHVSSKELVGAIRKTMRMTLPMKLVSTLQKERGALAAVNIVETFLDDWVRSGKFALARRRQSEEDKPVQPPLVRTEGPFVVRRSVGESLPEPLHFARPVTQGTGSKIAILAFGGRGHAQPVAAVTQSLMQRGHHVVVLTSSDGLDFFSTAHIEAQATYTNQHDLALALGGVWTPFWDGTKDVTTEEVMNSLEDREAHHAAKRLTALDAALTDPYAALVAYKPDLVLYTSDTKFPALRYETSHLVPALAMYFTTAFGAFVTCDTPPRPSLFATSAQVDAKLPENSLHRVTGPWCLQEHIPQNVCSEGGPLSSLSHFLAVLSRPVVATWGSMLPKATPPMQLLGLALRSLRAAGRRGIILGGWAKLHDLGRQLVKEGLPGLGADHEELRRFAEEKVFFAPHAPLSWLLPQCACVVHHGGAGTTHAAVAARCPSVVTPLIGDQLHFARQVSKLRVGVGFEKTLPHITTTDLTRALERALRMVVSEQLVARVEREHGATVAVSIIEDYLRAWVKSGRFFNAASKLRGATPEAQSECRGMLVPVA